MAKYTIGDKIKDIRKRKHLTQTDLAEALGYKDKSMIAHIENGDSEMAYEKILLFIKKFDVDANELFEGSASVSSKQQEIPKKIGPFKRYVSKDTTMEFGYYYTLVMTLPFATENKRTVRVWLPEDYDFERADKKYPVIYFSDGQNLVDERLSAFGEWKFDKAVHKLMKEGLKGVIAVGIDCPKDPLERTRELCPPFVPKKEIVLKEGPELAHTYGDKYINFIVYNLKPLINKTFHTSTERRFTGIGGSSMGGLMSFFAAMIHPEAFGFVLSFSPALFFYEEKDWLNIVQSYKVVPTKEGKCFLYCGGTGFEGMFLKDVLDSYFYFQHIGYGTDRVRMVVDTEAEHNEAAWAKVLPDALRFWLREDKPIENNKK